MDEDYLPAVCGSGRYHALKTLAQGATWSLTLDNLPETTKIIRLSGTPSSLAQLKSNKMLRNILISTFLLLSTTTALRINYVVLVPLFPCFSSNSHPPSSPHPSIQQTGTEYLGTEASDDYICGDPRLGPAELPTMFPLLSFVSNYDRFGGLEPGDFLDKWTNSTTGYYQYPPKDGFLLNSDGEPIQGNFTLTVGMQVDRFGKEGGKYIAAADAPFDQRALPPDALNTDPELPEYPINYRIYNVIKEFEVLGGPIAPWFGQPGYGVQFFTGAIGNVSTLIEQGYLEETDIRTVEPGSGNGTRCG
ncbi:MAG: hypothetical protein Q9169_007830 [Polycauliona sp. 2 TL-2023]